MTDSQTLERLQREMLRARNRLLVLALPSCLELTWFGLDGRPLLVLLAQLVFLIGAGLVWGALYRCARAAGGARYAVGQLLLSILLTPLLFVGIWAVPLLVASDIDKGVARLRAETAAPLWYVALDTLVVFALLVAGVALVGVLGLVGLFLAAVLVPCGYKGFRGLTRTVRP